MRIDKTVVDLLVGIIVRTVLAFAFIACTHSAKSNTECSGNQKIESFLKREIRTSTIKLNTLPILLGGKLYKQTKKWYNNHLGGEKQIR